MDFICCDDFKEDVVNIILLGYREKIRKSAMREKKYCTFNISSFTCCKGIFFLSTAESDQAFTKIGSKRWVSLSEKPLINSASFTFRSLWFVVLKSWKELQSCRQIIFPKPSHALQLWKQDVYDTSLSFLRCQKPLLLDMIATSPVERTMHEINVSWSLQQHHFRSHNFSFGREEKVDSNNLLANMKLPSQIH